MFKEFLNFKKQKVPHPKNFESLYSDLVTSEDLEKFHEWIPQSLQFMIDCLPYIRRLIENWSLEKTLKVLDVGAAHGAGSHLLATLYRSNLFGVRMEVDALENDNKYKQFAEKRFPEINFIVKDIFKMDSSENWNLIICSHTIEHLENPIPFMKKLCEFATDWVLFYAPFEETGIRPENHISTITMEMVNSLNPIFMDIFKSPGWDRPEGDRRCVLFVLKGRYNNSKNNL